MECEDYLRGFRLVGTNLEFGLFFFFGMLRVVLVLVLPMGMSPYT